MTRSEQDRQRDLDIIIEERAAEIQEQRLQQWLPILPFIFPFAFFLLAGHFFCKMIGIEPGTVSTGIALFTLFGGAISLFLLAMNKKRWEKYKYEIMPLMIIAILFIFVIAAFIRVY